MNENEVNDQIQELLNPQKKLTILERMAKTEMQNNELQKRAKEKFDNAFLTPFHDRQKQQTNFNKDQNYER